MKILVTGAAGFIGHHLVRRLLAEGHTVVGLDNFQTGSRQNVDGFPVVLRDVRDVAGPTARTLLSDASQQTLAECRFDRIYHLACPASPPHYQRDQLDTFSVAIDGTRAVLEAAQRWVARVFIASTSEVYGDPTVSPQPETYRGNVELHGPRSCFSDDTEILTREGWKLFADLSDGDDVATLDERGCVEYVRPLERIRQRFDGNMYHFSNVKMDLLVTPDHQMLDERGGRQFVRADAQVDWRHRRAPVGGIWPETEVAANWALPPRARNAKVAHASVPIEPWLEFVGMYIAEGCVTLTDRVLLAHDHGWKEEKIRACLEKLPWKFQELDHQFQIVNKQLVEALAPFGSKSIHKTVPREYINLPPSMLRILFDGMMLDGARSDGRALYTSSPALAEAAQEIALKIGLASSGYFESNSKSNPYSDRENYRLNFRSPVKASYPEPMLVEYHGDVFCVDAPPHHTVLVRRNKKAVFCGNCYDEGKRAAETMAFLYSQQRGVPVRIGRIHNTYGPGMAMDDGRAVPNFICQALRREPIIVYGSGRQTRSLCYVSDMVDAIVTLMEHPFDVGPVNIGSADEITINYLAEQVRLLCGSLAPIEHGPLPKDDPQQRRPSLHKAHTVLKWTSRIGLHEGLRLTIADLKARLERKD